MRRPARINQVMSTQPLRSAVLALTLVMGAVAPAVAQPRRPPEAVVQANAGEVRRRLQEILNELPPAVVQVLRLDPALLTRTDYIAPYPRLSEFVGEHPEVLRSPGFFLGE